MGRTLVLGDLHGAHKALEQCLERSKFDYENDTLIFLGDVADGWPYVYDCVETLLKVKNLIPVMGNHDEWLKDYISTGLHPVRWTQGGIATLKSYLRYTPREDLIMPSYGAIQAAIYTDDIPSHHQKFFRNMIPYYILENEQERFCFVHGGFDRSLPIAEQHHSVLFWDRELWDKAKSCRDDQKLKTEDNFTHIFIGHTAIDNWRNPEAKPMSSGGVTNIDTGAGWGGKLTIMDANSKEYWQSDFVTKLYPDETNNRR